MHHTRLIVGTEHARLVQDTSTSIYYLELWSQGRWCPASALQHARAALQRLGPAIDALAGSPQQEAEY